MKQITITNMTGARNSGCDALVASILHGLQHSPSISDIEVQLETADPDYDRSTFGDSISRYFGPSKAPKAHWSPPAQRTYFSALSKLLSVRGSRRWTPNRAKMESDLLIATGGDVFTSDYGSFAWHARVLNVGTPVALLGQTIGPFSKADGLRFGQSLKNIALCTVRESETLAYLQQEFPQLAAQQTADVAFLLPVSSNDKVRHILEDEHRFEYRGRSLIGLSISTGILAYRSDLSAEHYVSELAAFINALNEKGSSVILIPHVRERTTKNNDFYACRQVLKQCTRPRDNLLLSIPTLNASDYKGIIGQCEALVGARTHATIASMSQGIPTVSIAYSRKAWGIMRDYYGEKLGQTLTLDVADLSADRLMEALMAALGNGPTPLVAAEMKRRASLNFALLAGLLGNNSTP